jgi:hypothetical protein
MPITQHGGAKIENLRVYEDWPGLRTTKVPSAISYTTSTEGKLQWGHDIELKSLVMRWTKLELQTQERLIELQNLRDTVKGLRMMAKFRHNECPGANNETPDHLWLKAEDIIADFLKRAVRRWFDAVQADNASVFPNVPLDLIITHPGVSDGSLHKLYEILIRNTVRFGPTRPGTRLSGPSSRPSRPTCSRIVAISRCAVSQKLALSILLYPLARGTELDYNP